MFGWLKTNTARILQSEKYPDAEFFAEATRGSEFTPDISTLSKRKFQLLFVYGTQMRGHPEHELVNEYGAFAAVAYTGEKLTLWRKKLGKASFPIALENIGWSRPDWARPEKSFVQGELYAIETEGLIKLDEHYQNTLEFTRRRMIMTIPYRRLYEIPGSPLQQALELSVHSGDPEKAPTSQVVTTQPGVQSVRAWVYLGKPEYWDNQLGHYFDPVEKYHPRMSWLGDYYSFTQREYGK